jgi:exopolysaccharide biosynthesis polyprenyl glycosylphosphotransferase
MKNALKNNHQLAKFFFGIIDVGTTVIILFLSIIITNRFTLYTISFNYELYTIMVIVSLTWIFLLKATHVARIPRARSYSVILIDFIRFSFIASFILLSADWLIKIDNFPPVTITIFILLNTMILYSIRIFTFKFLKMYRANGHNLRNVIIIASESSEHLVEKIYNQKEWGFRIISIITDSERLRDKYIDKIRTYPSGVNIKSFIQYDIIDEVIFVDLSMNEQKLYELIGFCNELGVIVRLRSKKKHIMPFSLKGNTHYFGKEPFYSVIANPNNHIGYIVKHLTEISIAFLALFILSPFLLLISFLIAVTSNGPVIFKQERVGLRGRKFYIYKFRTMVQNAEEIKEKLETLNESDGPTFKMKRDPRITKIGRILRKTSFDEIPQLFNVINGEMSIIGPRPPLPREVEQYERWQLKRLSVKPGITCTWQIVPNRNDVKFDNWMKMDIQYIENWSLLGDAELFFKTFRTMLAAKSY